jgi:CxxC motif-containing protein
MKLVCINCPRGCELEAEVSDGEIKVSGQACPRGEAYAKDELTNPTRMVTGLVKVAGTRRPLPVKTRTAVPKGKISDVTNLLANTTVLPPKRIGDVVLENVCDTGVNVVVTANCCR